MAVNYNTGWLPHAEGLYTQHDDLVYQYMYIILHKERQRLGLLNPLAHPFYPATEEIKCKQQHGHMENNGEIEKHDNKKSEITVEEPRWITVNKKMKNCHKSMNTEVEKRTATNNPYYILDEDTDTEEDESDSSKEYDYTTKDTNDRKRSSRNKNTVANKKRSGNTITIKRQYGEVEEDKDVDSISLDERIPQNEKGLDEKSTIVRL